MQHTDTSISVVIPVYNEAGNVAALHRELIAVLDALSFAYEIIFVNDGSTDNTLEELQKLTGVTIVQLRRNFGQSAAFGAGIDVANGDIIVTMDGDRQNDPADIPHLLATLEGDVDVVCGWRRDRRDPLFKRVASRGAFLLRRMFINDGVHDAGCSLRAVRKGCFDHVVLKGEMHRFLPALLAFAGYRVVELPVAHRARRSGRTKYGSGRLLRGFIDLIIVWFWKTYANRPQHLFGGLGIGLMILGVLSGVVALYQKIALQVDLSDTALTLFSAFAVLVGLQLFVTGIIADMITTHAAHEGIKPYQVKEIIRNA